MKYSHEEIERMLGDLGKLPWTWGHKYLEKADPDYGPSWIGYLSEEEEEYERKAITSCDGCNISTKEIADFVAASPEIVRQLLDEVKELKATGTEAICKFTEASEENKTLKEALKRIAANQYGLQSLIEYDASEEEISKYWSEIAMHYQSLAREALAKVEGNKENGKVY